MYLYILASVLQLFHGPFQSEFPTECDLVLPLSISSIFSFPKGYPVAAHVFFLVFPLLMFFPLFLPLHIVKTSRVTGITARILKAALPGGEWSASRPGQCHYPPPPPRDDSPVPVGGWMGPRACVDLSETSLLPLVPVMSIHMLSCSYVW